MTGQQILQRIRRAGCKPGPVRQQGSHMRIECDGGKCKTTVPVHRGQDLPAGTLRAIERDLEPCLGKRWLRRTGR
ncbi:MAG TPA: type II toxin-antitoxin system HicA family toxin [Candidatus Dormibacteraeota bacterium]